MTKPEVPLEAVQDYFGGIEHMPINDRIRLVIGITKTYITTSQGLGIPHIFLDHILSHLEDIAQC